MNADTPAFPLIESNKTLESYYGLSKREFFIAHAPKNIPDWFRPQMRDQPKAIPLMDQAFGKMSDHPNKKYYLGTGVNCYWDQEDDEWYDPDNIVPSEFKKEVSDHWQAILKWNEDLQQWNKEEKIEHIIQWPIFWADQILKKLEAK